MTIDSLSLYWIKFHSLEIFGLNTWTILSKIAEELRQLADCQNVSC